MSTEAVRPTTCTHDPGRICDNCPPEAVHLHLEFWRGFDK